MSAFAWPAYRFAQALALALLLCVLPAVGFAQDDTSSDAEMAEKHFEAGAAYFYEKKYSHAIVEFRKAYRYQPDPMILFNVSAAHSRLGNYEDAREFALRAAESGELPDKIARRNDAHIAAWGVRLSADDLIVEVKQRRQAQASAIDDPGASAPVDTSSTELSALGWTGVSMVALGAGLAGYATYVDLSLEDDLAAYEKAAEEDLAEYERLRTDIDARQSTGRIALYSGVGLAGVGLSLWLYDRLADSPEDSATIGIAPGVDSASVEIVVPFR